MKALGYKAKNTSNGELCPHNHHSKQSATRCAREQMGWEHFIVVRQRTYSSIVQQRKRNIHNMNKRAKKVGKVLETEERLDAE